MVRPPKKKPFSHIVTRFLTDSEESDLGAFYKNTRIATYEVFPSKLRAYPLGVALLFGDGLSGEARKEYLSQFMQRISTPIEETAREEGIPLDVFKSVFTLNVEKIISSTLSAKYKSEDYRIMSGRHYTLDKCEKEMNASIFMMRMMNTIRGLGKYGGFKAACKDYEIVSGVRKDTSRFLELEELCKAPLFKFMSDRINGIDRESQHQEGLLAVWAAAKLYEGRNFARFRTLAKTALKNKFVNLIRYSQATKRRANRHLIPIGNASRNDDSYPATLLDTLSYEEWSKQQTDYDAINTGVRRRISHNGLPALEVIKRKLDGDECAELLLQSIMQGNPSRQIAPGQINQHVLNLPPFYRWGLYEKGYRLEEFDQEARMCVKNSFENSRNMPLADESNFPHLNEGDVELSSGEPDDLYQLLPEWENHLGIDKCKSQKTLEDSYQDWE